MNTLLRYATLLIGFALATAASAQTVPAGFVKVAEGEVLVMRAGSPLFLKAGDAVYEADRIATTTNQSIGITLRDNSRISAGPNTILVMQTFKFEPEAEQYGLVISVLRGTLSFVSGLLTKLAPETVRIETKTATVAVRGTRLLIRTEE